MYYFGERLRKLRKSRNLTQKQLAGLIRSTDSIISAYENGFRTPTLDNLVSISAVFHVTTWGKSGTPLMFPGWMTRR